MSSELLITDSLKATVVLVTALGLCSILRRAPAAARHLVWTGAFAALLLLPVLLRVTPLWTAPAPASFSPRIAEAGPAGSLAVRTAGKPIPAPIDSILFVWLLGATIVLARFAVGIALVWIGARRAQPIPIPGVSHR